MPDTPKVLVAEKLAESGVDALREHFDVDLGLEWDADELAERIGAYDGLLIRSATQVTADLISRADRLKVSARQSQRRHRLLVHGVATGDPEDA